MKQIDKFMQVWNNLEDTYKKKFSSKFSRYEMLKAAIGFSKGSGCLQVFRDLISKEADNYTEGDIKSSQILINRLELVYNYLVEAEKGVYSQDIDNLDNFIYKLEFSEQSDNAQEEFVDFSLDYCDSVIQTTYTDPKTVLDLGYLDSTIVVSGDDKKILTLDKDSSCYRKFNSQEDIINFVKTNKCDGHSFRDLMVAYYLRMMVESNAVEERIFVNKPLWLLSGSAVVFGQFRSDVKLVEIKDAKVMNSNNEVHKISFSYYQGTVTHNGKEYVCVFLEGDE